VSIQTQILNDLTGGELSPRFRGRPDLALYTHGALAVENFIPFFPGGVSFRGGFAWVGASKGAGRARLRAFSISPSLVYLLEIGAMYIRFWKNGALVGGASPVEITTTYAQSELQALQFAAQEGKVYIFSGYHPIAVLSLVSTDTFSFSDLVITGNAGKVPFASSGNYPRCGAFFDGRLYAAATLAEPQTIWASEPYDPGNFTYFDTVTYTSKQLRDPQNAFTGVTTTDSYVVTVADSSEFEKFKLGDHVWGTGIPDDTYISALNSGSISLTNKATASGSVTLYSGWHDPTEPEYQDVTTSTDVITDSNGFKKTLATEEGDTILWLAPGRDLVVGSVAGERIIPSGSTSGAFSCLRQTAYGSAAIQPFMGAESVFFVGANRKMVREYYYSDSSAAYQSPELTRAAAHILAGKVRENEYQTSPATILWYLLETGELIGCFYDKQLQFSAWFHVKPTGTAVYESMAVLPTEDGDILYVMVNRGGTRTIEKMDDLYGEAGLHLDASGSATVAARSIPVPWLSGNISLVYNHVAYPATVSSGAVAAPDAIPDGATVQAGYAPTGRVKFMPTQAADAKTGALSPSVERTVSTIIVRMLDSYPFKARYGSGELATAGFPGLYSGDWDIPILGGWERDGAVEIVQDTPLDTTILLLIADIDVGGN
jgi:hypothetical protein